MLWDLLYSFPNFSLMSPQVGNDSLRSIPENKHPFPQNEEILDHLFSNWDPEIPRDPQMCFWSLRVLEFLNTVFLYQY